MCSSRRVAEHTSHQPRAAAKAAQLPTDYKQEAHNLNGAAQLCMNTAERRAGNGGRGWKGGELQNEDGRGEGQRERP